MVRMGPPQHLHSVDLPAINSKHFGFSGIDNSRCQASSVCFPVSWQGTRTLGFATLSCFNWPAATGVAVRAGMWHWSGLCVLLCSGATASPPAGWKTAAAAWAACFSRALAALCAGTELDGEDTDQEQGCLKDRLLRGCPPAPLVTLQHLDQVLGEASWMEGVMLNTQFTWRWLMSHGLSDLEWYKVHWKHNTLQNTALVVLSSITAPVWFPLLVPVIPSPAPRRVSPVTGKEAQACCSFGSCLGLIVYVFAPPMLVWPTRGDIHCL